MFNMGGGGGGGGGGGSIRLCFYTLQHHSGGSCRGLLYYVILFCLMALYLGLTVGFIVSTGCIRWILWFSVRYMPPGSFHWEVSFSQTEISLILKNKMAAAGISLKFIYLILLGPLLKGQTRTVKLKRA